MSDFLKGLLEKVAPSEPDPAQATANQVRAAMGAAAKTFEQQAVQLSLAPPPPKPDTDANQFQLVTIPLYRSPAGASTYQVGLSGQWLRILRNGTDPAARLVFSMGNVSLRLRPGDVVRASFINASLTLDSTCPATDVAGTPATNAYALIGLRGDVDYREEETDWDGDSFYWSSNQSVAAANAAPASYTGGASLRGAYSAQVFVKVANGTFDGTGEVRCWFADEVVDAGGAAFTGFALDSSKDITPDNGESFICRTLPIEHGRGYLYVQCANVGSATGTGISVRVRVYKRAWSFNSNA